MLKHRGFTRVHGIYLQSLSYSSLEYFFKSVLKTDFLQSSVPCLKIVPTSISKKIIEFESLICGNAFLKFRLLKNSKSNKIAWKKKLFYSTLRIKVNLQKVFLSTASNSRNNFPFNLKPQNPLKSISSRFSDDKSHPQRVYHHLEIN